MDGELQRALRAWRDGLIDLSGKNRLLNFRHTRVSTLEIKEPGAFSLLDVPRGGWRFAELPEEENEEDERTPPAGGG